MARNKEAAMEEEMLEEGSGPRVYELAFHLDPELPSEEVKKQYAAIKEAVEAAGAIVAEGAPMMIQLAYTISRQESAGRRDFDSAYFAWIAYEAEVAKHTELLESLRGNAKIVRYLDILTTKEAARHAAEMQQLAQEAQQAAPLEGPVAEAELDAALEEATASV